MKRKKENSGGYVEQCFRHRDGRSNGEVMKKIEGSKKKGEIRQFLHD